MYMVQHVLRRLRIFVKVLASKSEMTFRRGRYRGWWSLGDSAGTCLGTVVWFEGDDHVRALDREMGDSLAELVGAAPSASVEPWLFFAAGAPKKGNGVRI